MGSNNDHRIEMFDGLEFIVEVEDDGYILSNETLNVHAFGATLDQAMDAWKMTFMHVYLSYVQTPDHELTTGGQQMKARLQEYMMCEPHLSWGERWTHTLYERSFADEAPPVSQRQKTWMIPMDPPTQEDDMAEPVLPEDVERVARAMHDDEVRQRAEREYADVPHLIEGRSSPRACDTAWAADGKTRGWWMDKARIAIRALRQE